MVALTAKDPTFRNLVISLSPTLTLITAKDPTLRNLVIRRSPTLTPIIAMHSTFRNLVIRRDQTWSLILCTLPKTQIVPNFRVGTIPVLGTTPAAFGLRQPTLT